MDDELGKAGSAKAGLNTGANGSAVGTGARLFLSGVPIRRSFRTSEARVRMESKQALLINCLTLFGTAWRA